MDLNLKPLWLFDVDNTLLRDVEHPDPFPDALHLCEALKRKGKTITILTNVGRLSARQIHGVIVLLAGATVIRLLPPLVITKKEIDTVVDTLQDVLG